MTYKEVHFEWLHFTNSCCYFYTQSFIVWVLYGRQIPRLNQSSVVRNKRLKCCMNASGIWFTSLDQWVLTYDTIQKLSYICLRKSKGLRRWTSSHFIYHSWVGCVNRVCRSIKNQMKNKTTWYSESSKDSFFFPFYVRTLKNTELYKNETDMWINHKIDQSLKIFIKKKF